MSEFTEKFNVLDCFLSQQNLDGIHLQRCSSFAWATCGADAFVNQASTTAAVSLFYFPGRPCLITSNIEAPRLEQDEQLKERGWEFIVTPWYEQNSVIADLSKGLQVGCDMPLPGFVDVSAALSQVRMNLSPQEGQRFRQLGQDCAAAMDTAISQVKPGQSEHEIAALLAGEAVRRGMQPIVNLVAADERIFKFRHPLPTDKKLQNYAMLVLCGRRKGLVCSITRLVHFGPLPDEVRCKTQKLAGIDAALILATRPGAQIREVFNSGLKAYEAAGYADEWQLHHQGGPAGYESREFVGRPDVIGEVAEGQAYAWNPSITGTKSEDTILVGKEKNEILTEIKGWPLIEVEIEGRQVTRPAILEIL